jgi:hypothetical protein
MNALLLLLSLAAGLGIIFFLPQEGPSAVFICLIAAGAAGFLISRGDGERGFLLRVFGAALLVRVAVGLIIYVFGLQEFFGGDAFTYDALGFMTAETWRGSEHYKAILKQYDIGWGMAYLVGGIYTAVGRNMLAVQFVNAVFGAATAPVIYYCAQSIFQNQRVSRLAVMAVAFYPSLILWSSQGLKDGPMVFLLALSMLATLRLRQHISAKNLIVLALGLFGIMSLRFYVFYMMAASVAGAFLIGVGQVTARGLARQFAAVVIIGLAMTYFGVLKSASAKLETYGNLEAVQRSRDDLAQSGQSGFGRDVDVSTTAGALSAIPLGAVYLLFAPFPWQLASVRQAITLPEMLVWWAAFPLLVTGLWFTVKHRLRRALPVLVFTAMLTLAYSVFQGNVGTAYRQRSQLLIFYFVFAAVGCELVLELRDDRRRLARAEMLRQAEESARVVDARRRYHRWKVERERELEEIARGLSERINF